MGNVILFRKAQKKREMEEELWERKARIEDARNLGKCRKGGLKKDLVKNTAMD